MKIVDGTNRPVRFVHAAIKQEASQNGRTSIVIATCDDETEVSISQHESGDWDITVDNEPIEEEYDYTEADEAVSHFVRLCQYHNGLS